VTGAALGIGGEEQRGLETGDRVFEVDGEVSAQVGTAPWSDTGARSAAPASATTAEHVAEQIADASGSAHVADVERESTRSAGLAAAEPTDRTHRANLVVLGALGLVTEHVVGG